MSTPRIQVTISDTFEPTARVRQALEALAHALEAAGGSGAGGEGEREVEGFGLLSGPIIRDAPSPVPVEAEGWRDGCWGFSIGPTDDAGSCGWYQYQGESCIGHSW